MNASGETFIDLGKFLPKSVKVNSSKSVFWASLGKNKRGCFTSNIKHSLLLSVCFGCFYGFGNFWSDAPHQFLCRLQQSFDNIRRPLLQNIVISLIWPVNGYTTNDQNCITPSTRLHYPQVSKFKCIRTERAVSIRMLQ